jgi:hypothetical protein
MFVALQTNVSRQVIELGRCAGELCCTLYDGHEGMILLG